MLEYRCHGLGAASDVSLPPLIFSGVSVVKWPLWYWHGDKIHISACSWIRCNAKCCTPDHCYSSAYPLSPLLLVSAMSVHYWLQLASIISFHIPKYSKEVPWRTRRSLCVDSMSASSSVQAGRREWSTNSQSVHSAVRCLTLSSISPAFLGAIYVFSATQTNFFLPN